MIRTFAGVSTLTPLKAKFEMTQFSTASELPFVITTPLCPPRPWMFNPRRTTLTPGVAMVTPSPPGGTEIPA